MLKHGMLSMSNDYAKATTFSRPLQKLAHCEETFCRTVQRKVHYRFLTERTCQRGSVYNKVKIGLHEVVLKIHRVQENRAEPP
jgi:hypothetical protein